MFSFGGKIHLLILLFKRVASERAIGSRYVYIAGIRSVVVVSHKIKNRFFTRKLFFFPPSLQACVGNEKENVSSKMDLLNNTKIALKLHSIVCLLNNTNAFGI